jgi:membrane protease subunit HflC
MRSKSLVLFIGALVLLAIVASSMFVVDEREHAIIFQFGEIKKVIKKEPGLYFKLPLIQNVRRFDNRILTKDVSDSRVLTSEKQNVIIDYFIKWRIENPAAFARTVPGGESQAIILISQAVNDGLRAEFGKHAVYDVISSKRGDIMEKMRNIAKDRAAEMGAEVVDVRIRRIEYPAEVSANVYSRMEAERKQVANERRSRGAAESERIRADADRDRDIIVADADREALQIKGEGDAKAAAIYGEAYGADPEFYAFYRSLEAYRATFSGKNDVIVTAPDADFFKYLKSPQGKR